MELQANCLAAGNLEVLQLSHQALRSALLQLQQLELPQFLVRTDQIVSAMAICQVTSGHPSAGLIRSVLWTTPQISSGIQAGTFCVRMAWPISILMWQRILR